MRKSAILFALISMLSACALNPFATPPGEGKIANEAFRKLSPVIQALEAYRSKNGAYPKTLQDLAPEFIPAIPSPERNRHNLSFSYFKTQDSYVLDFKYHYPGTNMCGYSFPSGWGCVGAY